MDASENAGASAESSSAGMDAKARREARKARILGAGTDRLARITKTGRGSEAELLYSADSGEKVKSPSATTTGGGGIDADSVMSRADAALANDGTDDPNDVDISQLSPRRDPNTNPFLAQLQQQQQQQQANASMGQQPEMPQDLQGMMKAIQEMMGGGGPGGPQMQMPDLAQLQQQFAQTPTPPPPQTSRLDVVFNLLRVLVFAVFGFALVYGAVRTGHAEAQRAVAEKATADVVDRFAHMSTLHRWARLAYERPAHWEARYFAVESFGLPFVQGVPVFWLFMTLEVGLASMRIMLHRSRPPPPGILLKVANFIPHAGLQMLLRAVASYLPLLDAFLNDVAVVVFCIGCGIMYAAYKVDLDPLMAPTDGMAADVMGAAGAAVPGLHDSLSGTANLVGGGQPM